MPRRRWESLLPEWASDTLAAICNSNASIWLCIHELISALSAKAGRTCSNSSSSTEMLYVHIYIQTSFIYFSGTKIRISEHNTKEKLVFLCIIEQKYLVAKRKDRKFLRISQIFPPISCFCASNVKERMSIPKNQSVENGGSDLVSELLLVIV